MSRLDQRLRQLQLLVLDVDGVLTDGGLGYAPDGQVWRRFDVRDGLGLKLLQQAGLTLAWISGGRSGAIERRAEDLGVPFCFSEVKNKQVQLQWLQQELAVGPEASGFVGDDLNDLVVRPQVGLCQFPLMPVNRFVVRLILSCGIAAVTARCVSWLNAFFRPGGSGLTLPRPVGVRAIELPSLWLLRVVLAYQQRGNHPQLSSR